MITDFLRTPQRPRRQVFKLRFETAAGKQAKVDFAQFRVEFNDAPGGTRILWLFMLVLSHHD